MSAAGMLGAAALWGISGGFVTGLEINGAAAASIVELTTGLSLSMLGLAQGHKPRWIVKAIGRRLAFLGLLESVNVLCYYEALQIAPVAPVMALHLTTPIMLGGLAFIRRHRQFRARAAIALLMMSVALLLIGISGQGGNYPNMAAGLFLSLVSAAALAAFVVGVGNTANDVPPVAAAGAQMLLSGLLLSPFLGTLSNQSSGLGQLISVSLLLFAPACWLYWHAMRRLAPLTAGTILLAEPFFGIPAAIVLYGSMPTFVHLIAAVLIAAAVYVDLVYLSSSLSNVVHEPP